MTTNKTNLILPLSVEEAEANGRLIAAAPDLLAACQQVKSTCGDAENWNGETRAFIEAIDAALAKATGGKSICESTRLAIKSEGAYL